MARTITQHEMDRRKLIAAAHSTMTDAMLMATESHGALTPLEWLEVFEILTRRVLAEGLKGEWAEETR